MSCCLVGEALRFTARGQSMWPYLRDGDVVEILPRKLPVSVGDIVFVPNVEFGQLHRVIALDRCGRALVRGDALHEPDGWFDLKQISGVLGTVVRRGRLVRVRRTTMQFEWRQSWAPPGAWFTAFGIVDLAVKALWVNIPSWEPHSLSIVIRTKSGLA